VIDEEFPEFQNLRYNTFEVIDEEFPEFQNLRT
jgi:hypothetical protein